MVTVNDVQLEVLGCVSKQDNIYRAMSFEPLEAGIQMGDQVEIHNHSFLIPDLCEVVGKTITASGRTIEDDIFNESEEIPRTIPTPVNFKKTYIPNKNPLAFNVHRSHKTITT